MRLPFFLQQRRRSAEPRRSFDDKTAQKMQKLSSYTILHNPPAFAENSSVN